MANSIGHARLPYCVRNARFTVPIETRDSTGALVTPTSPDTEFSLDAAAFADCAEEISAADDPLTLSGAETNGSLVRLQAKSSNGLTGTIKIYPRDLPILSSGTAQAGAAATITIENGESVMDYTGIIIRTTGGTGGGGTGGANNQARQVISTDVTSPTAVVLTVAPAWEVNPASGTTYDLLMTELWSNANLVALNRDVAEGETGALDVNVTEFGGTPGTFSGGIPFVDTSLATNTVQSVAGTTIGLTESAQDHSNLRGAVIVFYKNGSTPIARWVVTTGDFETPSANITIDAAATGIDTTWNWRAIRALNDVNTVRLGGTAQTGRDIGASVITATNNDKTGYGLSGTQTFNNTGTWTGNIVGTLSTLTTYTGNTPQTGDSYAVVNSGTHGNAAIKGFVDDIGAAGAGLTAVPWNSAWDTEVQSEVQDAIEANNLDHLVKIAVDTDFATTVHLNSVFGHIADNGTSATFDRATDSSEAIRDRGDAAWVTGAGGDPWTTTLPGAYGAGTAGKIVGDALTTPVDLATLSAGLITNGVASIAKQNTVPTGALTTAALGTFVLAKTTNITGFNDLSVSQVNTEADTALSDVGLTTVITGRIDAAIASRMATYVQPTGFLTTDFTNVGTAGTRFLTMIELDGAVYRFTTNAVEQVVGTSAAALWDTLTSGLSTVGSIGKLLVDNVDAPISSAGGGSTPGEIADAVWDEALAGHATAGSAGRQLSDVASGADVNVTITGLQANSANPRYSTRAMAPIAQHSSPTDIWTITDANNDPVDLSGKVVRQVFAQVTDEGDDPFELVDDTLEGSFKYETEGDGITVGGADDNQVTVVHDADKLATAGRYVWWLWNITDGIPLLKGSVDIEPSVVDVA